MSKVRRVSLADLGATLKRDVQTLFLATREAARSTAAEGKGVVKEHAPEAFAHLRDGIVDIATSSGARIVSTAPHSAAVEVGSRPHMPPIEPILEWVRLRGTQGYDKNAATKKGRAQAKFVRARISEQGTRRAVPVDAALQVAWAIALKIKAEGTEPTWFAQASLREIAELLDGHVKRSLENAL